MARMFPPSIQSFEHEHHSEIWIYDFLNSILPDNYYIFWNVRVNNKYPDFIIIEPTLGILILEVKDWALGTISGADVKRYYFKPDGRSDLNPLEQARTYALELQKVLEQEDALCQSSGNYKGKLKICYAYGVVFTNITQEDFINNPIYNSIDKDRILFKDDIEYIYHNKDIDKLEQKLKTIFIPKNSFKFDPLSQKDMQLIEQMIYKPSNINSVEKNILDKASSSNKESLHNENNKPKTRKSLIHNLKNMVRGIIKVILIIFTFNLCIILLAIFMGLYIKGDLRSIKDVPVLVEDFIEAYNNAKEDELTKYDNNLQPSLIFNIENNPQGNGTFILIKDGDNYLISQTLESGTTLDFYDSKKLVISNATSNKEEFSIENDVINLEVGNAYTKIYLNGKKINNLKYFKYDFANREIVK